MSEEQKEMNRRDFVKTASTGATIGALSLGGFHPAAAKTEANSRINVAHIGIGIRGRTILDHILTHETRTPPTVDIVGVCDVYAKRRNEAVEKTGAKPYEYYGDILDRPDVDAVFVATPDHTHAQIALEAMRKGKDVYLEKPMTHTIAEALELRKTVHETGRILQVGSQTTSNDNWHRAHEAISKGMIGEMIMSQGSYHRNYETGAWNYDIDENAGPDKSGDDHINWELWLGPAPKVEYSGERYFRFRKFWDYSGGIATDLFYHVMAPFNVAWPEPQIPYKVTATGGIFVHNDGRQVPDTYTMTAVYPKGHMVVLTSTMANDHHIQGTIRGHEGTVVITDSGRFEDSANQTRVEAQGLYRDQFIAKWGSELVELPNRPREGHMDNFLRCVKEREKPTLDVDTGLCAQVAITLGVESYRRGKVLYYDEKTDTISETPPVV
ncbi:MAG: Gfo/Idh/MocA family oxidoreductase [Candidatus Omnitrophica bacterium]|nr:Gfo/Idh/MocA family oxidoreductase [Candidatus Omnitrophota bacterium]MCB9782552.1 Gfo/Idh/MocA family oxidoreductase [Candidatus Omnitrophota bacterium]